MSWPILLAMPWDEWYWAAVTFAGGYILQWIGHLVEGNDLGEWAAIKRLLGLPYVAVSPRFFHETKKLFVLPVVLDLGVANRRAVARAAIEEARSHHHAGKHS